MENIFDAFSQADESTTRQFGGTGLGLAISRKLVEQMGGRIWAASEIGKGSVFHATFPFEINGAETKPVVENTARLSNVSVLIVDDNETNLRILSERLSRWGMIPETASGGLEALQRLEKIDAAGRKLPLIITDVSMPGMDGITFCQQVRKKASFRTTAIIVLRSADRVEETERLTELNIGHWFMKPVKQSELFRAVAESLGSARFSVAQRTVSSEPDLAGLNVLVAEDGDANQRLVKALLEKRGVNVTIAEDGSVALNAWRTNEFDIILMDVQMPIMDGLEATAVIRAEEAVTGQHIPIIALTARAMKGDRELCLEAGMDSYLSKPMQKRELYEAIARHVVSTSNSAAIGRAEPQSIAEQHAEVMEGLNMSFAHELPRLLSDIHGAIDAEDVDGLRTSLHTFKNCVRAFGIPVSEATAEFAEEALATDELQTAREAIFKIEQHIPALLQSLTDV
jgi:CheY-like chemotaxis protein